MNHNNSISSEEEFLEELRERNALETVNGFIFLEFLDYFGRFSTSNLGGYIPLSILPPTICIENRLKRTEKSTETNSVNSFLAPRSAEHSEPLDYQLMMAEIDDKIQGTRPVVREAAALRKLVAPFGDAYFFYNQRGDFCLLTDFLEESNEVEK